MHSPSSSLQTAPGPLADEADTGAATGEPELHWALLCLALAVLLLALALQVRGQETVVVPLLDMPLPGTCNYKRLIGRECPGCGLTRCFISLAHGDWRRAWEFNPAGIYFFAIVVSQIPYRALQLWRLHQGRAPRDATRLTVFVLGSLTACLLLQWLARMVM